MSGAAFDIAASGMSAHRAEMDVIAENIAHVGALRSDSGEPYRARTAVIEPSDSATFSFADILDDELSSEIAADPGLDSDEPAGGVRLAGFIESNATPQFRYDPGNPLAQRSGPHRGFVAAPDIDPIEQMVELVSAGRAYDADVASLQAAKQMDVEALEVDRT